MPCTTLLVLLALCLSVSRSLLIAGSFDKQFEIIKKTASKEQLYALLYDLHFGLSNMAEQWYDAATDKKRANGNEFYTRTRFNNCPDSTEPLIRFRTIQRSSFLALSAVARRNTRISRSFPRS